jgi:hypothetical protein
MRRAIADAGRLPQLRLLWVQRLHDMSFVQPSTRPYAEEVDMIFSALECALHDGHVIYASSEITRRWVSGPYPGTEYRIGQEIRPGNPLHAERRHHRHHSRAILRLQMDPAWISVSLGTAFTDPR